jgi:hypothetical protein
MLFQVAALSTAASLVALAAPPAAPRPGEWKDVEVITFTDFDDMEVKIIGKKVKAFMVGLRPLREARGEEARGRIREEVVAVLGKAKLYARLVTRQGGSFGLLIDTFEGRNHVFRHGWDPIRYPYCATGWGSYNFNLYFLYRRFTTPQDNFGDNREWKGHFDRLVRRMGPNSRECARVP